MKFDDEDIESVPDIIKELIEERDESISAFLVRCHLSKSFLRRRKGEFGFNPDSINVIRITNGLNVFPHEVFEVYERKSDYIPLRKRFSVLNVSREDMASTMTEYIDIKSSEAEPDRSEWNDTERQSVKRTTSVSYRHKVRLLTMADVVRLYNGEMSEFFRLLEGEDITLKIEKKK